MPSACASWKIESMRTSTSLVLISALVSLAATASAATSSSAVSDAKLLPLGDNKYVTTGAKRGYVYLCNTRKDSNAGSFIDGPWIQGNFWDPSKKVTVDGAVKWPDASFSIKTSGDSRVITTNALPSHTTGRYPISSNDDAYQYDRNPNSIRGQSLTVTLRKDPAVAANLNCMGGEVGIALTGAPIFNGFDAGLRDAVAHEIQDDHDGHPQEAGEYHYHDISDAVVKALTQKNQRGPVLVGYAYDGFGIYSGVENGNTLTNSDLDECHGKTSSVMWDGRMKTMYHYVVTKEFPYTVSCFKGTPVKTMPTAAPNQNNRNGQTASAQPQRQNGPPQEALNACLGKQNGNSCYFTDTHGSHSGTCVSPPEMPLVCAPVRGK